MKRMVTGVLLLFLGVPAAWGQTPAKTAKTATSTKRSSSVRRKAAPAVTAEDLTALRQMMQQQQQQIEQLRQEMQQRDQQLQQAQQQLQQTQQAAADAQKKAEEVQTAAGQQTETVTKVQTDVADLKTNLTTTINNQMDADKKVSGISSLVNRVRWTGDVRVRNEDFFLSGQNPRIRERIRLRLGIEGELNQDFAAGISFATGTLADPTTTNETLTNFFERKVVGFDRGYITYNPKAHKWLSLTGGKFAYTWTRTPQTFDNDLNPEGFGEKLSFDLHNPFLKNFTLSGMQLLFNENSATRFGVSGVDSFAAGGGLSAKLALGKRVTTTASYSALNWRNVDILLNAPAFAGGFTVTGTTTVTCGKITALNTAPSCAFATSPFFPNGLTNRYVITAQNASTGVLTRTFASPFLYSDLILDTNVDTGHAKWPWRILGEYLSNPRATTNANHAYLLETSIGQAKNKGDLQIGYAWVRQEQDSAIASFVESDQRLPTNVLQHRIYANYKLHPRVTAAYTLWIGRVLDTNRFAGVVNPFGAADTLQRGFLAPGVNPGDLDKYLKRMQFDLIYSF